MSREVRGGLRGRPAEPQPDSLAASSCLSFRNRHLRREDVVVRSALGQGGLLPLLQRRFRWRSAQRSLFLLLQLQPRALQPILK